MINVERIEVFNWEGAIRGMRNPMNSWEKGDSYWLNDDFIVGEKDKALMCNLVKAGSDERKFMRQILVSFDINAPFYFWKEFDTYKVGTVANSCSTMHTLHTRDLVIGDFSHEHFSEPEKQMLEAIVEMINFNRKSYIETKDKKYWYRMIQLLPTSYNQTRTVTLNYEVLRNIYHARKHHKLDEWREFCEVIERLPYSKLITMEAKGGEVMKMTCSYCNNEFTLDKIHIKKEVVKENNIVKGIFDVFLGANLSDETYKYFIYCPKCHKKIGKIN